MRSENTAWGAPIVPAYYLEKQEGKDKEHNADIIGANSSKMCLVTVTMIKMEYRNIEW